MIRVEPRNANSAIFSYGVPILSAVVALILASIPLWLAGAPVLISVSYTHLTLPTIRSV